jgi:hypothetical protein
MSDIGRVLMIVGVVLVVLGAWLTFVARVPGWRMPGDFSFGGPRWRVSFPLGTSIVLSVLLTLLLQLLRRR